MANFPFKMLPPRWEPPKGYLNMPGLFGGNSFTDDGTTATTATVPPPTTKKTPAGPPDYASLIAGDPLLLQQEADLSAQGIQSAAQRRAATQRALINFGDIPDFQNAIAGLGLDPNSPMFKMLFGDVDEMTRKAAGDMSNAHLSTGWGLRHAHEANQNDLMDRLAARGSLRSGGAISGLGMEDQNYSGAQFKARQELLDYLSGVQTAFAESERGRQGQHAGYLNDAATRQIQEHPYVPPSDEPPPPPPSQPWTPPQPPSSDNPPAPPPSTWTPPHPPADAPPPAWTPPHPPSDVNPPPVAPPKFKGTNAFLSPLVKRLNLP